MKSYSTRSPEPQRDLLPPESNYVARLRRRLCAAGEGLVKTYSPEPLQPIVQFIWDSGIQTIGIENAVLGDPSASRFLGERVLPELASFRRATAAALFQEIGDMLRISFVTADAAQSLEGRICRGSTGLAVVGPIQPIANGTGLLYPTHMALYAMIHDPYTPDVTDARIRRAVEAVDDGYRITLSTLLAASA